MIVLCLLVIVAGLAFGEILAGQGRYILLGLAAVLWIVSGIVSGFDLHELNSMVAALFGLFVVCYAVAEPLINAAGSVVDELL